MRGILAAGALLLLAGCTGDGAPPPRNNVDGVVMGTMVYRCANGERVEVRFTPDAGVASLMRAGGNIEMQRQPTMRGFVYVGPGAQIEGNERQMTMRIDGQPATECMAER